MGNDGWERSFRSSQSQRAIAPGDRWRIDIRPISGPLILVVRSRFSAPISVFRSSVPVVHPPAMEDTGHRQAASDDIEEFFANYGVQEFDTLLSDHRQGD